MRCGCKLSGSSSDESISCEVVDNDDVSCAEQLRHRRTRQQQQQQQQRRGDETAKKRRRRRIVQVMDSSTEDDLDISNNNCNQKNCLRPSDNTRHENAVPRSAVAAEKHMTLPPLASSGDYNLDTSNADNDKNKNVWQPSGRELDPNNTPRSVLAADRNHIPQSIVTTDSVEQNRTEVTSHRDSVPVTGSGRLGKTGPGQPSSAERSELPAEYSRPGQTGLIGSGQSGSVNRSIPSIQTVARYPAEYTRSGQTGLTGSLQSISVSRSGLSTQGKVMPPPTEVTRCYSGPVGSGKDVDCVKSFENIRSLNADGRQPRLPAANRTSIPAVTSDFPTFSLGFDEFLDSEDENDIDVASQLSEFTQIKPLRERISAPAKPGDDSPSVPGSNQGAGLCRSGQKGLIGSGHGNSVMMSAASEVCELTASASSRPCGRTVPHWNSKSGSGQPHLIGSGQPNSVTRSASAVIARSCSPAVSQLDSVNVSGQHSRTGSARPSCMNNSAASEAARLREERLRLSRLKKEEFQRKFASSNQTPRSSSPAPAAAVVNTTTSSGDVAAAAVSDLAGVPRTTCRILVDSRELSGAQVIGLCVSRGAARIL